MIDVTLQNFEAEVIAASMETPVLVDFWAPWCAPCKQLTPIIEKLVASENGRVRLAKINTDEQSQLAAIFGVRSLPTVMLIRNGQPVDGFVGVQPESMIREWLAPHLAGIEPVNDDTIEQDPGAAPLDPEQALALARAALASDPEKAELRLALVTALLGRAQPNESDLSEAQSELDSLPANLSGDDQAVRARARIEFLRARAAAPGVAELERRLAADADDHLARHQLAVHRLLAGDDERALMELLEIMRRDRKWQNDQARKSLIAAFHLVADADLVSRTRRQMAAMLF